jgi:DNA polymerase-2
MQEVNGWLLDVFENTQTTGAVLWFLTEKGERLRLYQPLPIRFYVAGPAVRLREVWRFLRDHPAAPRLSRDQKRDLFQPEPVDLLAVEVASFSDQQRLFRQLLDQFPTLTYYDADLSIAVRHAAQYKTFPLCHCRVKFYESYLIQELEVLDTRWDLDPQLPKLRVLHLEPDCDPAHAAPLALCAQMNGQSYRFSLQPVRPLLINLQALLKRLDPDLILTRWGDTWLLPYLFDLMEKQKFELALNRETGRKYMQRPERSYFSYGQIIYSGQQIHLFGRWHIDQKNATFWGDLGLDGIFEMARVTAQPVQVAARTSPGTGISTMQVLTALEHDILVPWHKQQGERPKTALELIESDLGGLVYQPIVGLHRDVGAIDFISMYPAIMVRSNISPETAKPRLLEISAEPQGLIPLTLEPLLEKRVALKHRMSSLPRWDPRRKLDAERSGAHKWLLVTCFGYLGYKNARFGRIESHEAVTAGGREALMRAKEASEDFGFNVLHMYVDGLWVKQEGYTQPADFSPLLDEIVTRTGLAISLDGVYRWVAFLPSRVNERVPVPNRYFGVFQDGSLKVRGLEARRRDSAPWVARMQMQLLEHLAQAESVDELPDYLPGALAILRQHLAELRKGRVPLTDLLVALRLTREPQEYTVKTAGARAGQQLLTIGKSIRPGQRVRLLYMHGGEVQAWDMPQTVDPRRVDRVRYYELAVRAASSVFWPMGIPEADLRAWLQGGIQLAFDFALPAGKRHILLPPREEEKEWERLFVPGERKSIQVELGEKVVVG